MAHLGYLNYTQYTVTVGFERLNQPVKEMKFTVSMRPAVPGRLPCQLVGYNSASYSLFWKIRFLVCGTKNSSSKHHRSWRSRSTLGQHGPCLAARDYCSNCRFIKYLSILGNASYT